MPLDYCRPTAAPKKRTLAEWYASNLMLERALDVLVRRVKNSIAGTTLPISPAPATSA